MAVPLTRLALSGIGVPPYATRGATQTLTPIPQAAAMLRTVNGDLDDLGLPQFQKYTSTINCEDQQPPAVDGAWPGKSITVDCIAELCYKTAGGAPDKPVVSGSSRVEGDFTFYRPQLVMRVVSFNTSTDEWDAKVSWSMVLEEI